MRTSLLGFYFSYQYQQDILYFMQLLQFKHELKDIRIQ